MNSITRHFKFLSEQLQAKKDTLEKLVNLYEYVPPPSPSRPQQSYRQPDGTYVDENGNLVYVPPPPDAIAQPPANEIPPLIARDEPGSPGVEPLPVPPQPSFPQPQQPTYPTPDNTHPGWAPGTSPTSGFAPTPDGKLPPQPKPPGPSQDERDQFSSARAKYYANLNKKAREAAEETLARFSVMDMSKLTQGQRMRVAVNKLRAQRAAKADKFSQEQIDRNVAYDTKERFMTPEEKAARKERDRKAVEAMKQEAERRYGPGGGVTRYDPRGDNLISGTSMSFNQFRERYGREYNALNKDDANLVRGAASNFASARISPEAQQAAQTSDEMNRTYAAQNARDTQRMGDLDRAVFRSQYELDRYRTDPEYRDQLSKAEMDKVRPGLEAEQRARDEESARIKAEGDANFAQGVQNQIQQQFNQAEVQARNREKGVQNQLQQQFNQAEIQARNREAGPGKVGVPSLLAKPSQEPKTPYLISRPEETPYLISRPEGAAPEPPYLIQSPYPKPPARPSRPRYTGMGSVDFAQAPELLRGTEEQLSTSPTQPQRNLGGEVTQRASTMNAQPLTGQASPTAPAAAPRQPLGSTVTPARPQPAPQPSANTGTVNTGGMNQPMDINDVDDEQQTGGPSERNRALPQPSVTPFVQRPLRGGSVTRAARTFNTRGNATSRLA